MIRQRKELLATQARRGGFDERRNPGAISRAGNKQISVGFLLKKIDYFGPVRPKRFIYMVGSGEGWACVAFRVRGDITAVGRLD